MLSHDEVASDSGHGRIPLIVCLCRLTSSQSRPNKEALHSWHTTLTTSSCQSHYWHSLLDNSVCIQAIMAFLLPPYSACGMSRHTYLQVPLLLHMPCLILVRPWGDTLATQLFLHPPILQVTTHHILQLPAHVEWHSIFVCCNNWHM